MPGPFVPLLVGIQVLLVASSAPPRINIEATCRNSEKDVIKIFGEQTVATFENCMRQEREALARLQRDWATFPVVEKERCVRVENYMPSYVEWVTCLDSALQVEDIRARERGTTGTGR